MATQQPHGHVGVHADPRAMVDAMRAMVDEAGVLAELRPALDELETILTRLAASLPLTDTSQLVSDLHAVAAAVLEVWGGERA